VRVGARNPALAPDLELIRTLAELLAEKGLTEIEYAVGNRRFRVARGAAPLAAAAPAAMAPPAAIETATAPAGPASLADLPGAVKAPMVGTAYLAPEPGAAAFVRLGDTVAAGQTLLLIEAMKVMNQIVAPRAGRVARILVGDAEPVEYGAVLMLIE